MSEDNFQPRVRPSREGTPPEQWPAEAEDADEAGSPPDPAEDIDDLLGPFDVIRRALEARRVADEEAETAAADATATPAPVLPRKKAEKTPPGAALLNTAPPRTTPPQTTPPQTTSANTAPPRRPEDQPTARSYPAAPVRATADTGRAADPAPAPIPAPERGERRKGRRGVFALIVAVCVLAAAGGVTVLATSHTTASATPSATPRTATPSPSATPTPDTLRAVAWVMGAIDQTEVVACDVTVCSLLVSQGFSAASLITVTSGVAEVEQADVVVLSAVVRGQLGAATSVLVSPEPLAVFGTGVDRVEVAAVTLDGSGTYSHELSADRASRRLAGTALLNNHHLTVDATARSLLAAGLVDTRVCALLAVLTAAHSVVLAGFLPLAPGAGPDLPSSGLVVESLDGQPATGPTVAATALLTAVHAQQPPYLAMSAAPGRADGRAGLQIVFSQPEPLSLLGSTNQ
jgi:hypothetical protein